jgi:AraC-like DNA-binding protein
MPHIPSPRRNGRQRFSEIASRARPSLDTLAIESGSSKSGLTRGFKKRYGISCGEYRIRQSLRWFVDEVRNPGSNAGQLAEQSGYSRYHNLVDALRQRTALTPREVRELSESDARDLVDEKLPLSALCEFSRSRNPKRHRGTVGE